MKASEIIRYKLKIDKKIIAYVVTFIVGVTIMLYPTISNVWNENIFKSNITSYDDNVSLQKDRIEEEFSIAKKYNESILPKKVPDAFSVREGKEDKRYEEVLNISGNGMMGYISIPVIDVDIPIYHYTSEKTLKKGVGHLFGSSLPIGGEGTHSVLSAHRGLPRAKLFSDLNLLEIEDYFYIHILDKTLKYEVDQILVVDPDQTDSLAISEGKDYITLVTCTPYGVNTQRLLVRGHRVPYDIAEEDMERKRDYKGYFIILLSIIAGIMLAFIITRFTEKMRENYVAKRRK